ncbi:hypothetical protein [Enterococcus faecalis]|uniref:hypothetical protein n=1 Tax=Enterococcus faecalis TaxID=1351 RepID=UPI00155E22F0|nr:hypothetical protein [Enterococcus faecalis]MDT2124370.1 hypothetical protein [Enterococcus faecalis]NRC71503.1 hypothetical protein [Enterococcus faecalis]
MMDDVIKEIEEHLEKAKKRAKLTNKDVLKVQSGIYFENQLNHLIIIYLSNMNDYLKANKETKTFKNVLKTDFIDNVLYDYFKSNKLWDLTLDEMIQDRERIQNLGDTLLDKVYKGLPLRTLLRQQKGTIGLYTDLEIFNKIIETTPLIFPKINGNKALLVNLIMKDYFLKNCEMSKEAFVANSKGIAEMLNYKFTDKHFQNYFKINKLTNDNFKNI